MHLQYHVGNNFAVIENIFGKIDDENEGDPAFQMEEVIGATKSSGSKGLGGPVNVYSSEKNAFCEDIDFGEVTIKGYIVNNKVGALKIEVENGPNNEESNKGLLNKYVQSNFGTFDTQNKNWSGYKFWNIGNKLIYYYKIKNIDYAKTAFGQISLKDLNKQSVFIFAKEEGVEGVPLFGDIQQDNFGKVNLKDFSSNSTVNFNLLGYQSIVLSIAEIKQKRIVKMYSDCYCINSSLVPCSTCRIISYWIVPKSYCITSRYNIRKRKPGSRKSRIFKFPTGRL